MKPISTLATAAVLFTSTLSLSCYAQDASGASAQGNAPPAATSVPARDGGNASSPTGVTDLMQAAQRLRDSTHALVGMKDIRQRSSLIGSIDQTLFEVESALNSLPPGMLVQAASESARTRAENAMAAAADRLHAAASALGNSDPKKKALAIRDLDKALSELREERMKLGSATAQVSPADTGH